MLGLILLLVLVAVGFGLWWGRRRAPAADFELRLKQGVLTPTETAFFERLQSSLGEDFHVFAKARILNVIEPSLRMSWLQATLIRLRLADRSFDYLLCNKADMVPFAAVVLEQFDSHTNKKLNADQEQVVSDACQAANLSLFFFDARQSYRSVDIRRLITGKSKSSTAIPKKARSGARETELSVERSSVTAELSSCPKCHAELVTKVAVKGKRIGEKFLMCRKFPYCDYQMSLNDAKVLKMKRRQSQKTKKPGFSDWAG